MTYGPDNRLSTYNGQNIQYDADGNMTLGPLQGQIQTLQYDCRNRLVSAGTTSYTYDAQNQRTAVNQNGQETRYTISPGYLSQILIRAGPDGQKTWYIYGLGLIGQENQDGSYQSYHYDYRGSTTAITSLNGAITDHIQYDSYGKITHREGTTDTPFLYNGRDGVMSDANGLYYMRARYYNPEILRFINQDILFGNIADPQSLNRYAYVNGQPINYVDPFGLCREDSDQFLDDLQTILDIMGLVPGIGEPFDGINAIIYLLRGDYGYAALSIGALIPVLGIGATGGKIAGKAVKGAGKTISYTDYDNIYQSSIHNAGKNKVMLGKYDGGGSTSYINKAGKDYEYFSLGNDWNKIKKQYGYTDDDMFKLFNESFLDDGINAGKTFQFSHNPVKDTGSLGQEYQYLLDNNYKWDAGTMTMYPRK